MQRPGDFDPIRAGVAIGEAETAVGAGGGGVGDAIVGVEECHRRARGGLAHAVGVQPQHTAGHTRGGDIELQRAGHAARLARCHVFDGDELHPVVRMRQPQGEIAGNAGDVEGARVRRERLVGCVQHFDPDAAVAQGVVHIAQADAAGDPLAPERRHGQQAEIERAPPGRS
jgi:hypothetical protein